MQRDLELTPLDVFKSFDCDFDGKVSKNDLKKALVEVIGIKERDISDARLDRLISLMSFFKTPSLQPSDFERLLTLNNPYLGQESATLAASLNFKKSMGGALKDSDMHNWKI